MTVDLVIAGRRIRLHSREGLDVRPDERFSAFTVPAGMPFTAPLDILPATMPDTLFPEDPGLAGTGMPSWTALTISDPVAGTDSDMDAVADLVVEVEPGQGEIPASAEKVFDAQLMEEVPGGIINSGEPFWEIFSEGGVRYARVFLKEPERKALLVMPHGEMRWRIFTGEVAGASDAVNPLPYPLDGLLLYFLFSRAGDIMIHGSGVSCHGRGWLFTGRSGSGKTTLARIFDRAGDRIIHDDRLVLRREDGRWVMYNTPVYRNDEPRSAPLDHLWIIRHGSANVSEPVTGAEAVAMILANCIQQNWDREAAVRLTAAADDLASSVRVSRLSFLPDGSIRDYLRLRKEEDLSIAAGAAEALLSAGKNITVTAGGYSMWPAIRPGDKVEITPSGEGAAAAGRIVALRRDGGFVLHRITRVMTVSGRRLIVTCGDAATRADEPAGAEMIAGMVHSLNRSGRLIPPPRRRWPRWFNRMTARLQCLMAAGY